MLYYFVFSSETKTKTKKKKKKKKDKIKKFICISFRFKRANAGKVTYHSTWHKETHKNDSFKAIYIIFLIY